MPRPTLDPIAVSVEDAAALVGFKAGATFEKHFPGTIFQIGNARRVRVQDVRTWIDEQAGAITRASSPGARLAQARENSRNQGGAAE